MGTKQEFHVKDEKQDRNQIKSHVKRLASIPTGSMPDS